MSEQPALDVERLLSGESGIVAGRRARSRARVADVLDDAALWARLVPPRLMRAARAAEPGGPVLVLGLYSGELAQLAARTVEELGSARRRVSFALGALDDPLPALAPHTRAEGLRGRGKFENLNFLLERGIERQASEAEWVLVVDDDVELPSGFLDGALFLTERFGFQLAQPALRHTSHAAWAVGRRTRGLVARLARMVEIGPLTIFHRSVLPTLLPFPPLRMGWGLDLHWGALALERGWRLGILDAVPIRHEARVTASGYDRAAAVEELRAFLSGRPHLERDQVLTVVERYRSWKFSTARV
jgi:hypothetical protein